MGALELHNHRVQCPSLSSAVGFRHVLALEDRTRIPLLIDLDAEKFSKEEPRTLNRLVELIGDHKGGHEIISLRDDEPMVGQIGPIEGPFPLVSNWAASIDGSYVIFGGFGGLGKIVSEFLVQRGAKYIVLCGRNVRENDALGTVHLLNLRCDVGSSEDVRAVFEEIEKNGFPPCKGIVQSAGIVADANIDHQSEELIAKSFTAKGHGTVNIYHEIKRRNLELDFLVLFSSIAGVLGDEGQLNHASACAFEDGMASFMQSQGIRASSINWGAWSDVGAAADKKLLHAFERKGMYPITPQEGLAVLEWTLIHSPSQVGAFRIDFSQGSYNANLRDREYYSLLAKSHSYVRPQDPSSSHPSSSKRIIRGSMRATPQILPKILNIVHEVLGVEQGQSIDVHRPLMELGFDSILAVEFRGKLEKIFNISLSPTLVFDYPTISAIQKLISESVGTSDMESVRETQSTRRARNARQHTLQDGIILPKILNIVREVLNVEQDQAVDIHRPLLEMGFDSILAVEFRGKLEEEFQISLSPTLVFDYPTISSMQTHISECTRGIMADFQTGSDLGSELYLTNENRKIALVSMACRFPMSPNLDVLWRNLMAGKYMVREVSPDRWDPETLLEGFSGKIDPNGIRYGGYLDNVDMFDPLAFGISPREANFMDPQQRMILELTWEAMEQANMQPFSEIHSRTGVFMGVASNDYASLMGTTSSMRFSNSYFNTGTSHSVLSGRVSHVFGFSGPSMSIDTACSSSLLALHEACVSLLNHECDMAVAGGANLILVPNVTLGLAQMGLMSPTGKCHTYDASADGFVRSEGMGVVMLKRLDDAVRNGDHILTVIESSSVNQDGRSSGLTAPNVHAQEGVIRESLHLADLLPSDVEYVEAHGTGTRLGDAIEMQALQSTFSGRTSPLYVTSVKTSIGHLEAGAGIASIIRAALSVVHGKIAPHLHFEKLNPTVGDISRASLVIPTKPIEWNSPLRRVLVTSFGFSGTNVAVVMKKPDQPELTSVSKRRNPIVPFLLPLSSKTQGGFEKMRQSYATFLSGTREHVLQNAFIAACLGRSHFSHRRCFIGDTPDDILRSINNKKAGHFLCEEEGKTVWFLTTGFLGESIVNDLRDTFPAFACVLSDSFEESTILTGGLMEGWANSFLKGFIGCVAFAKWVSDLCSNPVEIVASGSGLLVALVIMGRIESSDIVNAVKRKTATKEVEIPRKFTSALAKLDAHALMNLQNLVPSLHVGAILEESLVVLHFPVEEKDIIQRFTAESSEETPKFYSSSEHDTLWYNLLSLVGPDLNAFVRTDIESHGIVYPSGTRFQGFLERAAEMKVMKDIIHKHKRDVVISVCVDDALCANLLMKGDENHAKLDSRESVTLTKDVSSMLALAYNHGVVINWGSFFDASDHGWKNVSIPTYAFDRQRCWFDIEQGPAVVKERSTVLERSSVVQHHHRKVKEATKAPKATKAKRGKKPKLLAAQDHFPSPKPTLGAQVHECVAEALGMRVDEVPIEKPLGSLGVDSIMAVSIGESLSKTLGIEVSSTIVFDYPTIARMTEHLSPIIADDAPTTTSPQPSIRVSERFEEEREAARRKGPKGHQKPSHIHKKSKSKRPVQIPTQPLASKHTNVQQIVRECVCESVGMPNAEVSGTTPLGNYGVDSIMAVQISENLSQRLGIDVTSTIVFDHPTIDLMSKYLSEISLAPIMSYSSDELGVSKHDDVELDLETSDESASDDDSWDSELSSSESEDFSSEIDEGSSGIVPTEDEAGIAAIGMAVRFPGGAVTPESLWDVLRKGLCTVSLVPEGRWKNAGHLEDYARMGSFLENVDGFDADFFGMTPREADSLDPQQRFLLELSWSAIEDSGYDPVTFEGKRVGVFIGITHNDYSDVLNDAQRLDPAYFPVGNTAAVASGRLSHTFNWRGPAVCIDTACSSSLVALHMACQSLLQHECDIAIAGGVNLMLTPDISENVSSMNLLSKNGACFTFDSRADGYVRGEGAAIVVLKRRKEAIDDHDHIYGVVRGSSMSHDGRASSISAPSGPSQEDVIKIALEKANVRPESVGYIETHGTGTQLGDPIEVQALSNVFDNGSRPSGKPLFIGSIKANFGHCEPAAGVASFVKALLCLEKKEIPIHCNFKKRNPHIKIRSDSSVSVPSQTMRWEIGDDKTRDDASRLVGVSSFGVSGTNVHMVLEESDSHIEMGRQERDSQRVYPHCLPLSAKSDWSLMQIRSQVLVRLRSSPELNFEDVCYTLSVGRSSFSHRACIVATSIDEAIEKLETNFSFSASPLKPRVVFFLQGHTQNMEYRTSLTSMVERFGPSMEMFSSQFQKITGEEIGQPGTKYQALAEWTMEVAFFHILKSNGVVLDGLISMGAGSISGAFLLGMIELEEAIGLAHTFFELQGEYEWKLPAFFLVDGSPSEVSGILRANKISNAVSLVACEEKGKCIVACDRTSSVSKRIRSVFRSCESVQREYIVLQNQEKAAKRFKEAARSIRLLSSEPSSTWVTLSRSEQIRTLRNARSLAREIESYLHISQCKTHIVDMLGGDTASTSISFASVVVACGRSLHDMVGDVSSAADVVVKTYPFEECASALFTRGIPVNWRAFYDMHEQTFYRVSLPYYAFEKKRHWVTNIPLALSSGRRTKHLAGERWIRYPIPLRQLPRASGQDSVYIFSVSTFHAEFLRDHRVGDNIILPFTSYIDMGLAVIRDSFGTSSMMTLDRFSIAKPFPLSHDADEIALICTLSGEGQSRQLTFETIQDDLTRVRHALATVSTSRIGEAGDFSHCEWENVENIDKMRSKCTHSLDPDKFYKDLAAAGVARDGAFRGILDIRVSNDDDIALTNFSLPDSPLIGHALSYIIHPSFLDNALQTVGLAVVDLLARSDKVYLPTIIEDIRIDLSHFTPSAKHWCLVHSIEASELSIKASVSIGRDDTIIGQFSKVVLQAVDGQQSQRSQSTQKVRADSIMNELLHRIEWVRRTRQFDDVMSPDVLDDRSILVFGSGDMLQGLKGLLQKAAFISVVESEITPARIQSTCPAFSVSRSAADLLTFKSILEDEIWLNTSQINRIIVCLDPSGDDEENCLDYNMLLLFFVQALVDCGWTETMQMVLLTRDGNFVHIDDTINAISTSLIGFWKAIVLERREAQFIAIDIHSPSQIALALQEMNSGKCWKIGKESTFERDMFLSIRSQSLFVPRLKPVLRDIQSELPPPPYTLASMSQTIDGLQIIRQQNHTIGPDDVEIRVVSSGLNFRDVLTVLGYSLSRDSGATFGTECSGYIVRTGENVTRLKIGDPVFAIAPGSFSSHVAAHEDTVHLKPDHLSFDEAVTLPVAFATAFYSLHEVAHVHRGQRVLIHSATGAVGLGCIICCQRAGAIVYATCSTEEKKQYLLEKMGVKLVSSSRNLNFRDKIIKDTNGEGVDIIVNSLAGDFITKSFEVLKPNGYFIELGKTEHWSEEKIKRLGKTVHYEIMDFSHVPPKKIAEICHEIMDEIEHGRISSLPFSVHSIHDFKNAFRMMQQAKHIGKIIISHVLGNEEHFSASLAMEGIGDLRQTDHTKFCIVDGATGGIGRFLVEKLLNAGFQNLLLLHRSDFDRTFESKMNVWRDKGRTIRSVTGDFHTWNSAQRCLDPVLTLLLKDGVDTLFHTAGATADKLIQEQSRHDWETVFDGKVNGILNLWRYFKDHHVNVGQTVLFSSQASFLGSPGQSNYCAANAFLDGFALSHRSKGDNVISIDWGTWDKIGMASDRGLLQRQSALGVIPLQPEECWSVMQRIAPVQNLMYNPVITHMNWNVFSVATGKQKGERPSPLFEKITRVREEKMERDDRTDSVSRALPEHSKSSSKEKKSMKGKSTDIVATLKERVSQLLGLSDPTMVDDDVPLQEQGIDSLLATEFRNVISQLAGVSVPVTILFDCPTILALAAYVKEHGEAHVVGDIPAEESEDMTTEVADQMKGDIAIVSIAGRYPKSSSPEDLWKVLVSGTDAVEKIPKDRFDVDAVFDPTPGTKGKTYSRVGSFIDGVETFDSRFFGITASEAVLMDPQQRIVLELCWEALENAGIPPSAAKGTQMGVFIGIANSGYARRAMECAGWAAASSDTSTGNSLSILSGRVAYVFGFEGPALSIDTACSSSLVAIHTACQSLRSGECVSALAGGVNMTFHPETWILTAQSQALSMKHDRCMTFDSRADGFIRGEGAGMVLLKRMSDAKRDGDIILGRIRGSGMNSDGRSNGLTAPNPRSQESLMRQVLKCSGLQPSDVTYLEAHGTGTQLGDPVEMKAIRAVYCQDRSTDSPLVIGSLKTNFGHMEAAAGVAGFEKLILCLQHRMIPPHLHFTRLNPHIPPLSEFSAEIPTTVRPWCSDSDEPLRGAISSFGFSGTNCHIIVEEVRNDSPHHLLSDADSTTKKSSMLVLSARNTASLHDLAHLYAEWLSKHEDCGSIDDVCYTAAIGRETFAHRIAVIGNSSSEIATSLRRFVCGITKHRENVVTSSSFSGSLFARKWEKGLIILGDLDIDRAVTEIESSDALSNPWREINASVNDTESKMMLSDSSHPGYVSGTSLLIWVTLLYFLRDCNISFDFYAAYGIGELAIAVVYDCMELRDAMRLVVHARSLKHHLGRVALRKITKERIFSLSRNRFLEEDETSTVGCWLSCLDKKAGDEIGDGSHNILAIRDSLERLMTEKDRTSLVCLGGIEHSSSSLICPRAAHELSIFSTGLDSSVNVVSTWDQLLNIVALSFCTGDDVCMAAVFAGSKVKKVLLPNYPFQRERLWIDDLVSLDAKYRANSSETGATAATGTTTSTTTTRTDVIISSRSMVHTSSAKPRGQTASPLLSLADIPDTRQSIQGEEGEEDRHIVDIASTTTHASQSARSQEIVGDPPGFAEIVRNVVGDHRSLANITDTEWTFISDTLREEYGIDIRVQRLKTHGASLDDLIDFIEIVSDVNLREESSVLGSPAQPVSVKKPARALTTSPIRPSLTSSSIRSPEVSIAQSEEPSLVQKRMPISSASFHDGTLVKLSSHIDLSEENHPFILDMEKLGFGKNGSFIICDQLGTDSHGIVVDCSDILRQLWMKMVSMTRDSMLQMKKDERSLITPSSSLWPVRVENARGVSLWDRDGNCYIDFSINSGRSLFAHRDDRVLEWIGTGMLLPSSASFELKARIAHKLSSLFSFGCVLLLNSRESAISVACELAVAETGREHVMHVWSEAEITDKKSDGIVHCSLGLLYDILSSDKTSSIAVCVLHLPWWELEEQAELSRLNATVDLIHSHGIKVIVDEGHLTGRSTNILDLHRVNADLFVLGAGISCGMDFGVLGGSEKSFENISSLLLPSNMFDISPIALYGLLGIVSYFKGHINVPLMDISQIALEINTRCRDICFPCRVAHRHGVMKFVFSPAVEPLEKIFWREMMLRRILLTDNCEAFLTDQHTDLECAELIEASLSAIEALHEAVTLPHLVAPRVDAGFYPTVQVFEGLSCPFITLSHESDSDDLKTLRSLLPPHVSVAHIPISPFDSPEKKWVPAFLACQHIDEDVALLCTPLSSVFVAYRFAEVLESLRPNSFAIVVVVNTGAGVSDHAVDASLLPPLERTDFLCVGVPSSHPFAMNVTPALSMGEIDGGNIVDHAEDVQLWLSETIGLLLKQWYQ
eukprot:TRINITY_DN1211_c0_g1_i1.p1 TRINITY_DN1211_c0_g1~~TRINITY_DN1211_c0_g1_i1.p1  ORF type:complete len:6166 (-),score=1589.85 TRINITY_DN1211_c0_g1_i1:110-16939(-)